MRFISLFAGIGGFDLGFERAGMVCVAQVENDPFCQQVLAKHWPYVPRFGDVRDVGRNNLPEADVICGGFPCQPHSVAGKRAGAEDDRNLWPEYRRIVEEMRPGWVVAENVPGIRTTILDQVLFDLGCLGYTTTTLDLPACAFNAWHIRHRYFVVAHASCEPINVSKLAWQTGIYAGGNGVARAFFSDAVGDGRGQMELADGGGAQGERASGAFAKCVRGWELTESPVCGTGDGIPDRLDRIRTLGNAVVPLATEFIGIGIMRVENAATAARHEPSVNTFGFVPCDRGLHSPDLLSSGGRDGFLPPMKVR